MAEEYFTDGDSLYVCARMTPDRRVGENLYRRGEGTLCYFFTTEDLSSKAVAAGFQVVECKYACTRLVNRKKQFEMRRVFVHGVFRKPDSTNKKEHESLTTNKT